MERFHCRGRHVAVVLFAAAVMFATPCFAADHLDTPSVIADPRADIGDLFAWTSHEGRRLNLAMTIVGPAFSAQLDYMFHIDSGKRFGATTETTSITWRIAGSTRWLARWATSTQSAALPVIRKASKAGTSVFASSPECATIHSSIT